MQILPSEMQVALPRKRNFGVKWSRDPTKRNATPDHEAALPRGAVGGRVGGPLNTLPQISILGHYLTPKQCENSPQDISNQNNLTGTKNMFSGTVPLTLHNGPAVN